MSLKQNARDLRSRQTAAESLLWGVLRNRKLCNQKFRRQHPIGPWIVDFACVEHKLAIELDGGYHDLVGEADLARQSALESFGWTVLRFENHEVLADVNSVAIGIARTLGLEATVRGESLVKDRAP